MSRNPADQRPVANLKPVAGASTVAVFLLCGGTHLPADESYAGPQSHKRQIAEEFAHAATPSQYTDSLLNREKRYTVRRVEIDSQHERAPHFVVIDYFDPPDGQPSPVLLVLPILGGDNEFAQISAKHFADHGYAALIVHWQKGYKKATQIEEFNPIFEQIVLDHKRVIDWTQTQEDLDPQRISLFGVSAAPPGFRLMAQVAMSRQQG